MLGYQGIYRSSERCESIIKINQLLINCVTMWSTNICISMFLREIFRFLSRFDGTRFDKEKFQAKIVPTVSLSTNNSLSGSKISAKPPVEEFFRIRNNQYSILDWFFATKKRKWKLYWMAWALAGPEGSWGGGGVEREKTGYILVGRGKPNVTIGSALLCCYIASSRALARDPSMSWSSRRRGNGRSEDQLPPS